MANNLHLHSPKRGGADDSLNEEEILKQISKLSQDVTEIQQQLRQFNEVLRALFNGYNALEGFAKSLQQGLRRFVPRTSLSFEFALAEHCNLNCRGCDHFSPIAEPQLADFTSIAMDFARLSALFDGKAERIHILGGEPLLHPDIVQFLKMARKNFGQAKINVVTNGLLLLKVPEIFWKACRDNNINIIATKYPIPLDYEAIENKASRQGVSFEYFGKTNETLKTLFQHKLSANKTQDAWMMYLLCNKANRCIYLQDGRLYTCTVAPTVRHFDKKFGTHIFNAEENSIDIYAAKSAQEIMQFLSKPIPFCAHCRIPENVNSIKWCKSNRTIDEWT